MHNTHTTSTRSPPDVALIIGDHLFYAHLAILCERSDLFEALVADGGPLHEIDMRVGLPTVNLSGTRILPDTMVWIMSFVYGRQTAPMSFADMPLLWKAAAELQMPSLREAIEDKIRSNIAEWTEFAIAARGKNIPDRLAVCREIAEFIDVAPQVPADAIASPALRDLLARIVHSPLVFWGRTSVEHAEALDRILVDHPAFRRMAVLGLQPIPVLADTTGPFTTPR